MTALPYAQRTACVALVVTCVAADIAEQVLKHYRAVVVRCAVSRDGYNISPPADVSLSAFSCSFPSPAQQQVSILVCACCPTAAPF